MFVVLIEVYQEGYNLIFGTVGIEQWGNRGVCDYSNNNQEDA